MLARAAEVQLHQGAVLYRRGDYVGEFYFFNSGLTSLILDTAEGESVEIGTRGVEAVTMPETIFGSPKATFDSIIQVPGTAYVVRRDALRELTCRGSRLESLINGYIQTSIRQIAQTSLCNRLHTLEERFCRWLLVAADGACSDNFPITHEFFSLMLGVGRPALTLMATKLKTAGLIAYTRGHMKIKDAQGLRERSCECYRAICSDLDQLFGTEPDTASRLF